MRTGCFKLTDSDSVPVDELIAEFCKEHDLELDEQVHKLSEETGEVSGAFLSLEGKQRFKEQRGKEHLAKELAQVIYTVETIAYLADIDLWEHVRGVILENSNREAIDDAE